MIVMETNLASHKDHSTIGSITIRKLMHLEVHRPQIPHEWWGVEVMWRLLLFTTLRQTRDLTLRVLTWRHFNIVYGLKHRIGWGMLHKVKNHLQIWLILSWAGFRQYLLMIITNLRVIGWRVQRHLLISIFWLIEVKNYWSVLRLHKNQRKSIRCHNLDFRAKYCTCNNVLYID